MREGEEKDTAQWLQTRVSGSEVSVWHEEDNGMGMRIPENFQGSTGRGMPRLTVQLCPLLKDTGQPQDHRAGRGGPAQDGFPGSSNTHMTLPRPDPISYRAAAEMNTALRDTNDIIQKF